MFQERLLTPQVKEWSPNLRYEDTGCRDREGYDEDLVDLEGWIVNSWQYKRVEMLDGTNYCVGTCTQHTYPKHFAAWN